MRRATLPDGDRVSFGQLQDSGQRHNVVVVILGEVVVKRQLDLTVDHKIIAQYLIGLDADSSECRHEGIHARKWRGENPGGT